MCFQQALAGLAWALRQCPFFFGAWERESLMADGGRRDSSDDLAILQEILWLQGGQLDNFHPIQPPPAVMRFLRTATLGQLQGMLVELLAAMRKNGRQ